MLARRALLLLTISSVLSFDLAAIDRDSLGYEQLLVPLSWGPRGAFGSLWRTELLIYNEGDVPAQVFQSECGFFCGCGVGVCVSRELAPSTSMKFEIQADTTNPASQGGYLYVGRSAADEVALQFRVRDVSRDTTSLGTEVPLVRQDEFRDSAVSLLGVPLMPPFRTHLRVYGFDPVLDAGEVRVAVLASDTDELIDEHILRLSPGGSASSIHGLAPHPAYGEITKLVKAGDELPRTGRIRITPMTPGLRFWAFVAAIHNETQHLTLITPQ